MSDDTSVRIALVLGFDELQADVESGAIDTVVVAFTDMQGRLMGKRLHGEFFVEEVDAGHAVEGCNYLLALEMEMDPVPGYALASWERGYGDFALRPDLATLRRIPWLEATALVLCDVQWHDGSPVAPSPRQVLRAQVERAEALGFTPMFGSELEFFLLKETYEEAYAQRYEDLTPSVPYILDYHILASTYDEGFIRQIRNGMQGAGMKVETSKGEAWPGQHEINFRYADALTMADNHVVYKNGAKELAHLNGCSITFMAKPDHTWIGSSCHIHSSLWRGDAQRVRRGDADLQALARRPDRESEGARDLPGAERELVQALRGRLVGTHHACLGPRQPHLRLSDRRARAGAADGDADPRRGRESLSRLRGDHRGRAATGSRTSDGFRRRSRAMRTSRTPTASRTRCARRSRRSRSARWRAAPSATRSSTTTSTTRAPSRSCSTASSRRMSDSGSSSGASLGFEVMQAPIGPAATVELVAAVCAAGGLGSLAASWTRVEDLRDQVRALAGRRFCVNLVLAFPQEQRLEVLCEERVPVISFSWGIRPDLVSRAHEAGAEVLIQVGSADAAQRAIAAGADIVMVQGIEAGGHVEGVLPLHELLAQVQGLEVPVVAAGGIAEAADATAAREAGAGAVAAGTAFLVAEEADRHPGYVERLLAAEEAVLTDVFSIGWPDAKHRVLANAALAEGMPAADAMPTGTLGGDAERMALYAGTGVRALSRVEPAAAIVDRLTLT